MKKKFIWPTLFFLWRRLGSETNWPFSFKPTGQGPLAIGCGDSLYRLSHDNLVTTSKAKWASNAIFTLTDAGKTEEAINFYASVFHKAKVGDILRYGKGEEPDKDGTIKHAGFALEGQDFAAMDSAYAHNFTFNEAISFMVTCKTQREIDYYWEKLTAGGEESVCGWLKDKYGVSWQVTPSILNDMLQDPEKEKVERVTVAFLKMKKFEIAELEKAYKG